jgi:hypothetical protein
MSPVPLAPAARSTDWPWLEAAAQMAELAIGRSPAGPGAQRRPWSGLPRVATRTPGPTPHSVRTARLFALRIMQLWGVTDRAEDVGAVVSELLSNALRHALTDEPQSPSSASWRPIQLGLLHPGPCVLCAVADPSPLAPVPRQPDWRDEGGRGLQLIESLSDRWGFCPLAQGDGKVVWATFATSC